MNLKSMKTFLALGAGAAALSVATGAFGAHALEGKLSGTLYRCLAKSHTIRNVSQLRLNRHWYLKRYNKMNLKAAGWMMFGGIVIFSGSLLRVIINTNQTIRRNHSYWRCSLYRVMGHFIGTSFKIKNKPQNIRSKLASQGIMYRMR